MGYSVVVECVVENLDHKPSAFKNDTPQNANNASFRTVVKVKEYIKGSIAHKIHCSSKVIVFFYRGNTYGYDWKT